MITTNLKSLFGKLSANSRQYVEEAANIALSRTHHEIDIEHILLKVLEHRDPETTAIMGHYEIDPSRLENELHLSMNRFKTGNTRNPVLSTNIPVWLQSSWLIASVDFSSDQIHSGHLLLGLLSNPALNNILEDSTLLLQGIPVEDLRAKLPHFSSGELKSNVVNLKPDAQNAIAHHRVDVALQSGLDQYTTDLTARARAGKIDQVLGRDAEIRQMVDILLRRRQNNPILTGEAGVGKTAVVEGLALRIAHGDVPDVLQDVTLRTLDLGLLQAGASVKGEFENRLRGVIDAVKASPTPIILFIDEAHTLIGAGGQAGQNDAANLLKPALARGELRTIAATTWAEYKKYFEKDAALARRFQVVKVEEPSEEQAVHMLRGIAHAMVEHHRVRILDAAVIDAVKLSSRYLTGRQLPDKAISVLDTACARVSLSRASKPAAIETLTREIENIDREIAALQQEQLARDIHAERICELTAQRKALDVQLKQYIAIQNQQTDTVARIDTLREELHLVFARQAENKEKKPASDTKSSKVKEAAALKVLRKSLEDAENNLLQLHQDQALVFDCVDSQLIAEVISGWTGIPLGKMLGDELDTVRQLPTLLKKRVIGQDHALDLIGQRIQITRANLEDPVKPKGVFLLVGPSGVGKTETALALADTLFGGERNLVTINMSEYQEAHSVSGLKGSPPGYVGFGEGGRLTEAVRRKPYSVVLLDEVEKAHPDVLELFFQVFDKGVLEDAEGREVDFRNTIILLTSNAGTDLIMQAMRYGVIDPDEATGVDANGQPLHPEGRRPEPEELNDILRNELQRTFKPAFLGRLTVVPYYPVEDEVLKQIVRLKLQKIADRVFANHQAVLQFDEALVNMVTERCTEVDSGARNADAILTNTILADMSSEILSQMAAGKSPKTIRVKVGKTGALTYKFG